MAALINRTTRRLFLAQTAGLASVAVLGSAYAAESAANRVPVPVIDCHVHLGTAQQVIVPWNTMGDPAEILRNMRKGKIDRSVIFPMSNSNRHRTFEEGNRE